MSFDTEIYKDIKIETINLDRATITYAEEFKSILKKDIEDGMLKIIIDLNNCEFMDSVFLGALVSSLKQINRIGGDIKICGSQSAAKSMLEITGAARVFDLLPDKETAIKSFNKKVTIIKKF